MIANICSFGCWFMAFVLIAFTSQRAESQDVSWLDEVQRPPENLTKFNVGELESLLIQANGTPVSDIDTWLIRRKELATAWQSFLGPGPETPSENGVTVLKTERVHNVDRSLIRYECEPKLFVEAYLLRPAVAADKIRRPGLVALHQTTPATIDEIAGVSGPESLQIGRKLAQQGFVVICPRCFLWQEASSLMGSVDSFHTRHPSSLGMRKMLFDAQRAVDILAAQPDVDAARLGAIGHSLGAKEVLYLAAFDDRIKAAVASEGGITFGSTNWDAAWYLGPKIHDPSFRRNHHELLAMIAPRAFLILGGESGPGAADGDRSWPLIAAALPVHRLYSDPARLGLLNHHQGHSLPDDAFERMSTWLHTYLGSSR